ncbi:hypothetical protein FZEAL_629 [Fusarium zealandicum]|uniref:Zn(2)-C6 fungal-type domain-containing protein n=1 Tax=Fusarium zealandicum TaxID=1053134 RepID=A0A8H4UUT0_9HYPO|nr:hypothetical protein FZEAL_629 [Fusarium zealandicum]
MQGSSRQGNSLKLTTPKCNEAKPVCGNCTRLELTCVYDRAKSPGSQASQSTASRSRAANDIEAIAEPPESEARRKCELKLLYHYVHETGPSIAVDDFSYNFAINVICQKAFESDALLYCLYMLSALHIDHRSKFTDREAADNCRTYLNMAIREHHKEIAHLNKDNVDFVCLTSSLLRVYSFIKLQERILRPYNPPVDWLRMTGSSAAVFRRAWDLVKLNPQSVAVTMISKVADYLDDNENKELRQDLIHLMRREEPHELEESWDPEIEAAYGGALSFIGGTWKSMRKRHAPSSIGRRLVVFPMLVHKRFVDLVEEQRPRALVILAHYFALLSMLRGFWWIGDSGSREFHAIADAVPAEWQSNLSWPRQILEDQIVFTDHNKD